jgi:hypothetical protein
MSRRIRTILAAAILITAVGYHYRIQLASAGTQLALRYRLDSAIGTITQTQTSTFDRMITETIIHEAIRGHTLHDARRAVLDEYLCPAFKDKYDQVGRCYTALYGNKSGRPEFYYPDKGLPLWVSYKVDEFRKAGLEGAKSYLAQPRNLWSFYTQKETLILTHVRALSEENRKAFLDQLLKADKIFGQLVAGETTDHDPEITPFAKRRMMEGGIGLVGTYKAITNRLLGNLLM